MSDGTRVALDTAFCALPPEILSVILLEIVDTKPLSGISNLLVTCNAWKTFFVSLSCYWETVFRYMKIPQPTGPIGNNFWEPKQRFLPFLGCWTPAERDGPIMRSDVTISFVKDACLFSLYWEFYQSSYTSQGGSDILSIRNARCYIGEHDSANILRCEGSCASSSEDDFGTHYTGESQFILRIERTSPTELLLHFTQGCTQVSWKEYQAPHIWRKF
jgi:hypothetical protein